MRRALALIGLAALAGCGDDSQVASGGDGSNERPRIVVLAAAPLKEALTACSDSFPDARLRLRFAGPDELAAQIRRSVAVDVFAAADARLLGALAQEGTLDEPVTFATARLVLAVPADSEIDALEAIERPGVTLAIGAEGMPAGDYTRDVLARLGAARAEAVLANVRSNEPDVKGIVGKLIQGAVEAGFVYATDVEAAGGKLRAIELPARLKPTATYGAGVVAASRQHDAAEAFVDDLLAGSCHDALLAAGFRDP